MKTWNICLTHDPASGGLYRSINDFAAALDASILSFDDGRRDRSGLGDHAVRLRTGEGPLSRDCHVLPKAAATRAAEAVAGADLLVVHSLFRAHTNWAAAWARLHGKPYWAVPHGCLDPWSLRQRGTAKRLWLAAGGCRFLTGAARVIFSTRRGLEKAARWMGSERATAVHWPVQGPQQIEDEPGRSVFRRRLGIPEDAPVLLFVGRLHTVKRPIHAVAAFCRASAGPAHLVIVGMDDDVTAQDVMRAVPPEGEPFVHAVGGLTGKDLANAYRAADGFVSLSFQENFGYAVAEAAAYGLPVIVSPGHDLAHDMPTSDVGRLACGWLLPDDSLTAASLAISEWAALAAGAPTRLAEMGATGRAWARETLGPERFRDELRRML